MEIRKAMQRNATLEEMCNLCIPIFEKPIFITDRKVPGYEKSKHIIVCETERK